MKLRDHFQIFRRAAKFTFSTNRKYTVLLIVNTVLSSIIGYVPIYFSAKVIDSLVAKSSIETVILYVALTVGIVFAVNLLNTYIASEKNVAYSAMWRNEDWSYSEKAMQMKICKWQCRKSGASSGRKTAGLCLAAGRQSWKFRCIKSMRWKFTDMIW